MTDKENKRMARVMMDTKSRAVTNYGPRPQVLDHYREQRFKNMINTKKSRFQKLNTSNQKISKRINSQYFFVYK